MRRQLADVNKEKDLLRTHLNIQRKQMDRHKDDVDLKSVNLGIAKS